MATRSAWLQSTRPLRGGQLGPAAQDGHRRPDRRAHQEAGLPQPVVAARSGHPTGTPRATPSTSTKPSPKRRPGQVAEGVERTGGQLAVGHRAEGLVRPIVAEVTGVGRRPAGRARRLEAVDRKQIVERAGRGRGRIDHGDPLTADGPDRAFDQGVVGAAQEERVDARRGGLRPDRQAVRVALAQQAGQLVAHDRLDQGPVELAGLDQRDEGRRGVLEDLDRRILFLDRVEISVRANRGRGRDHAYPAGPGREGSGHRPRPDHAQDRQVVAPAQVGQGDCGRSVAGDHDRLDVAFGQPLDRLPAEQQDLLVGARSIRRPGVVAEVDRRFGRHPAQDLAEHGQAADAGVEDADGTRVGHRA